MLNYKNYIFVGENGTILSPLAAGIFNMEIIEKQYKAEARGLVVLFPEPANSKVVAVAKSNGVDLEDYLAKQLSDSDFSDDTLVLVTSDKLKARIYDDYKEAINVYSFSEFIEEAKEIADPYGEELASYGKFYIEVEDLVKKIIFKLYKE